MQGVGICWFGFRLSFSGTSHLLKLDSRLNIFPLDQECDFHCTLQQQNLCYLYIFSETVFSMGIFWNL